MSVNMEQAADAILQAAYEEASSNELSDIEIDGDGSSSLSDLDTKDSQHDEDGEESDDNSNQSEDENDSEAETERLEESPNKVRTQKDVVLSSQNQSYERSPSKLNSQIIAGEEDDGEDDGPLSDDEMEYIDLIKNPRSSVHETEPEPPTAATSLESSAGEGKRTLSVSDADTRKRKRSIMAGGALDEDVEEPLRKRTGSILTPGDDYAVEDEEHPDEENGTSNPISGTISGEEDGEDQDEETPEEIDEPIVVEEEASEAVEDSVSPKKRGRKKKKGLENGIGSHDEEVDIVDGDKMTNGEDEAGNGEDENAENEVGDEAEAALKNEDERK